MTADEILAEIKPLAKESYKKTLLKHGVPEPVLGVSIEELKKVQKRVKKDYQLALDLYDTGIYDAMYLAGLIADDARMTKKDLQRWVEKGSGTLCGFTVPWVAAGSKHGWELALKWIDSKKESISAAGWTTLVSLMSIKDDDELDLEKLKELLERVENSIHDAPNSVRYAMNTFVIGLGTYVKPLAAAAMKSAKAIGEVTVDMGQTACKVPYAPDYIKKVQARGSVGKKRKSAKC
jgi:3-methyladenine DNA glycosylase AlkD